MSSTTLEITIFDFRNLDFDRNVEARINSRPLFGTLSQKNRMMQTPPTPSPSLRSSLPGSFLIQAARMTS